MADKIFADGLIFKAPREGAPEFVKASISIKVAEFISFLEANVKPDGWLNLDVKESRGGKLYCELNTYQRGGRSYSAREEAQEEPVDDINPDDIPF
jgi:hypothetical protein